MPNFNSSWYLVLPVNLSNTMILSNELLGFILFYFISVNEKMGAKRALRFFPSELFNLFHVGCKGFLGKSLFMFGGYGGNDYNVLLLEVGLTPEQAMKHTPKIVNAIANGVEVST
jgi:hypothetical protein